MLCTLHSIASAILPAAAPIFAMAQICGAVPGKLAFPGLYWTSAGRL